MNKWIRRIGLLCLFLILIGCVTILKSEWDKRYGPEVAREFQAGPVASQTLTYQQDIKPLVEQRCTVCHGCYDAPCQLKTDSYQGLLRGASQEKVYDGRRLLGAAPTRIFEDAQTTAEWRAKNFFPVLNERKKNPANNINLSLLAQSLILKQHHPLPQDKILPDSFDFSLNAPQACPTIETYDSFKSSRPLWGMPYGLPALSTNEHQRVMTWLRQGAAYGEESKIPDSEKIKIAQWEKLLNDESLKGRLSSRYIYEHLFLAQLFFDEKTQPSNSQSRRYYRLVRSKTPPGKPIDRISSLRPFDDPGVAQFYYRLWRDPSSVVAKTHMPYALNTARMMKWRSWFYDANFTVTRLPSYELATASNPFVTFAELPVDSRYRFMLEEARFTIMNFIKGPVCRGQLALNVIQDHFWVFFFDPDTQNSPENAQFLQKHLAQLELPAEAGNSLMPITNWQRYANLQREYLSAKAAFVASLADKQAVEGHSIIWNGGKEKNPNAALTIFRHSDSASVYQGLIGNSPKTAWVIGYPLLERIYYLLVAGFDVYGNLTHQLLSRMYMDFLRIEGEMNFVGLLPEAAAKKEIKFWYRDAEDDLNTYLDIYLKNIKPGKNFQYTSGDPKLELYEILRKHLGPVADSPHQINTKNLSDEYADLLNKLRTAPGNSIRFLPQTTVIRVPELGLFTLVHNTAYSNLSHLFGEEKRRIPEEDYLTITRGIIGYYPSSFMQVSRQDMPDFVAKVISLNSEEDYRLLKDRYGIRRSDPDFWQFSDQLHQDYYLSDPGDAAILDYNRLENR